MKIRYNSLILNMLQVVFLLAAMMLVPITPAFAESDVVDVENVVADTVERPPHRLVDEAGLLNEREEVCIEASLNLVVARFGIDMVIVTVPGTGDKDVMTFADDFFDDNGYGLGSDRSGILLLRCLEPKNVWVSTRGKGMDYLCDADIDLVFDSMQPLIESGLYLQAFMTFITESSRHMRAHLESLKVGWFDIAIVLIIALIASWFHVQILKSQLSNVATKTQADDYLVRDSLQVAKSSDVYLYTTTTKVRVQSDSGGRHTSSSGATHGGRGRSM